MVGVFVPCIVFYFFIRHDGTDDETGKNKQTKKKIPKKTGDTLRDFDVLSYAFIYLFPVVSLHEKVCWWTLWDLSVMFSCFPFLSKQPINCMGALWYQLHKKLHVLFLATCVYILLLPWVFVLSCLEIKESFPDNMSPKVLLHCMKSGRSDRCFLSCSSDVRIVSGKSKKQQQQGKKNGN